MTLGSRRTSSGVPSGDLDAEVEHHDVVADVHHEVHVVLDEQHADAPIVGEAAHEVRQLGGLGVAESGRRLVEQQHARLGGDRARDGQQPALTVRQVVDGAEQVVLDAGTREIAATTSPGSGGSTGCTRSRRYDNRSRGSDAARRLSSTVESSNSSSDWNDRDNPARTRLAGESPSSSRPSSVTDTACEPA